MLFTQTLHAAAAQLDTPPPSTLPLPGKLCHLHNLLGEQGRAGGVAGGTGERFILKQFKIFSCNYMSTSRKSRQDNDKDNGENRARSTATAARLFIGKHKHKYKYTNTYTNTHTNTDANGKYKYNGQTLVHLDIFEYRRRYLHIASFELGTEHRKNYVTLRYWCLDFCILYNGAYDYFKFARAKYCAYAALAKRQCETGQV